jgi:hypothetical protein
MTRITIDDELRKKLLNFSQDIELCDDQGLVIARVQRSTPLSDPENWVELTPPISEEELQAALNSQEPGISTAELKEYLRKR